MKWNWQHEIVTPVVLVGVAWLTVTASTTWYLARLEREHRSVLGEHIASIRAVARLQEAGHQWIREMVLAQERPDNVARRNLDAALAAVHERIDATSAATHTVSERQIVGELQALEWELAEIARRVAGEPLTSPNQRRFIAGSERLFERCERLIDLNESLIADHNARFDRWQTTIRATRVMLSVLGLALGVWFGYRAASRLQRRVAAIRVSLDDASAPVHGAPPKFGRDALAFAGPISLGQVEIVSASTDSLEELDRSVHRVAERLRHVVEDLAQARQEAERNERLAVVGQLASGVAHELRNPLTAVKLLVQTQAMRNGEPASVESPWCVIQEEIERMEHTIQSLLDYARPPAARRLRHDVRGTLQRALNLVQGRATKDRVRVAKSLGVQALVVDADPEQLHQVFVNLLINGMDAMPEGGTLHVELSRLDAPDSSAWARVEVRDEGAGIPGELLGRLFEPFVTTKSRGVGLGLAVSRRIVSEHGGRLLAENAASGGARLLVELPISTCSDDPAASFDAAAPAEGDHPPISDDGPDHERITEPPVNDLEPNHVQAATGG